MNLDTRMRTARLTNQKRDAKDRRNGFAPPAEAPVEVHLGTVIEAVRAGIEMSDWDCVAEGLAMLEDLKPRLSSGVTA